MNSDIISVLNELGELLDKEEHHGIIDSYLVYNFLEDKYSEYKEAIGECCS